MIPKMFTTMPHDCALFYSIMFNRIILNLYAVDNGLFDTRFCETTDPTVPERWNEAVPSIVAAIRIRQSRGV